MGSNFVFLESGEDLGNEDGSRNEGSCCLFASKLSPSLCLLLEDEGLRRPNFPESAESSKVILREEESGEPLRLWLRIVE